MRILIFGSNGQVGDALVKVLTEHNLIVLNRNDCDLQQVKQIKNVINYNKPDLIINAAAYTNVDKAEIEKDIAFMVNCNAPRIMSERALELNIPFIHLSTDYVFDGMKVGSYTEGDQGNPINTYGKSKLAGEQAIQEIGGQFYIFRTSWVYSNIGKNFYLTIKKLIKERRELKVVVDQLGVPTSSKFLADNLKIIINQLSPSNTGIYHLVPDGYCSWYEFAEKIIDNNSTLFNKKNLLPISIKDYDAKSKKPINSVLDNNLTKTIFMLKFNDWEREFDKHEA